MTIIAFPRRLPPHIIAKLSPYDRAAAKKGTITVSTAEEMEKDRLRSIMQMPELEVFGGRNNGLAAYFAFDTSMTVDSVRAEARAIRAALAKIGIPGMAIETQKDDTHE